MAIPDPRLGILVICIFLYPLTFINRNILYKFEAASFKFRLLLKLKKFFLFLFLFPKNIKALFPSYLF